MAKTVYEKEEMRRALADGKKTINVKGEHAQEKFVNNEASMHFPLKQMVLKRIVSLKKSSFVRPQLPGFINANNVKVLDIVIDRNELDSFVELPACYNYIQVASKTGDVKTDEFLSVIDKLVCKKYNNIIDCGAYDGLDDGLLSVLAVSYSGVYYIRREKELPEGASDLDRMLFEGRRLVHGYKDDSGKVKVNFKEGCKAYRDAAAMGAPEALFEMGAFYHHGIECEKDSLKAKSCLEAAANSASARWSCAAMDFALEHGIQLDIH